MFISSREKACFKEVSDMIGVNLIKKLNCATVLAFVENIRPVVSPSTT